MAGAARLVPFFYYKTLNPSNVIRIMEMANFDSGFESPKYLQTASIDCADLVSENENHVRTLVDVLNEETATLEKISMKTNNLLQEIERGIAGIQSTGLNIQEKKEENLRITKEAFSLLRKALNDREHHLLHQINAGAERKSSALNAQQQKLIFLESQVRNHLNLVNQAAVGKMREDKLHNCTVILEQRMKDLVTMKNSTTVEPIRKEQALVHLSGVQQLCEAVSKFGILPYNGCVEHAWEHTVPVDRCATLTITVRDVSDECVPVKVEEFEVKVFSHTDKEVPAVIKDIGGGKYTISFVPEIVGSYDISILVAGQPVPQSPYR